MAISIREHDTSLRPRLAPVPAVVFAGRFSGTQEVPFHDHPGTELVLVTAGRCTIGVRDEQHTAAAGDLLVLPARVPHNQRSPGPVRTTYTNVLLPRHALPEHPRVVAVGLDSPLAAWLEQLADFQRQEQPAAVRDGLALAVVESLNQVEHRAAATRALHPGLARALRRIEDDLLEDLTANDLARAAGLSPSHLTALFRARFACGPLAYHRRQRLELACRLLRDSYLAVGEVAAACGYPDANYFTRLFRQAFGCAPRAWRERTAGDHPREKA